MSTMSEFERGQRVERERVTRIIRDHPTPYPYEGLGDGVASAFRNSLLAALRVDSHVEMEAS